MPNFDAAWSTDSAHDSTMTRHDASCSRRVMRETAGQRHKKTTHDAYDTTMPTYQPFHARAHDVPSYGESVIRVIRVMPQPKEPTR